MGLPFHILPALWRPDPQAVQPGAANHDLCFQCARSRRTQLFAYARERACTTIAFGHHRDDIIETFLLNLTCAGNISTMSPRQNLFSGRLALIRPLAYLDKSEIEAMCDEIGLKVAMGGAFAKAMSGKKDDIIKALLNVAAFPYESKVPRSMRFNIA